MNLLFTRSHKIGSRIICLVTGEDVSHVGVQLGNFVVHATFSGVRVVTLEAFRRANIVVHDVHFDHNPLMALDKLLLYASSRSTMYDYPAIVMLGLMIISRRIFGRPDPITRNPWQKPWLHMCTEFALHFIGVPFDASLASVITPGQLHDIIKDANTYDYSVFL